MENTEIAKIFWEMAELLELKEDNPFKIRAYQKAAQNIENLSENAEEIIKRGIKIPGVGEKIAQKIKEIITTGKLSAHQKLLNSFPKGFLELIKISGLGPKGALLLYKKLKVKNIDDLEKAAKGGEIQKLPGMGPKKEENILKGIEQYRERRGRFLLSEAQEFAETIIQALKKLKEAEQISPAGSLRRFKETIGDIDILVTAKNSEKIMDAFAKLPQVEEVLAKGLTKSSVVLKSGMQADLRVIDPKSFGAALHYFTGSKQHNIRIREMGVKKKLKISEYGVFKNNKMIAGKTEEEVFKSVGLPFIPPELRENRGEIEAAQKNKLPELIELKDLQGDLQMHTRASDGGNTMEEMLEFAKKLGYKYISITEHSISSRVAGGLSEEELVKQWKKIDEINKKLKDIKILKGIEVDIKPDGNLDYRDSILKQAEVIIAAVHSKFTMDKNSMTQRIIRAMQNKYVNILAHPTGRLLSKRPPYEVDLEKVIAAAAKTGTFIEINAHPERLDLDDIHCKRAKEQGVGVVINTDAHSAEGLNTMKFGVSVARRGWLTVKDVLNTLPLEKLLKKLYSKRQ